jgi:hypothetical protein
VSAKLLLLPPPSLPWPLSLPILPTLVPLVWMSSCRLPSV